MAKKSSTKNKDVLKGTNVADVLTVKHSQVTVNAGKGNDTINVTKGSSHKIYGEAGKDTITVKSTGTGMKIYGDDAKGKVSGNDTFNINAGKKNYFYGGKGVDTFNVNAGTTNYIYGGAGNDVIVISKKSTGTAVVKDFSVKSGNKDSVKVTGGAVKSIAASGKNMIVKGGKSASVTLEGARTKTFTVTDTLGSYTVSGANVKLALGKNVKGTVTAASFLTTVDARSDANAITINGNAKNNTIYGGAGNNILNGGGGHDTLTGGAGKDTFVYANGGGNDTITDYVAGQDTLQISSGSISKTTLANSNKDLVFTVGNGNITLKNAATNAVSLKDSRGSYTASNTAITLGSDFAGTMDAANYLGSVTAVDGKATANAVTLKGNANDNIVYGGTGENSIYGFAGSDKLYGNAGTDKLYGGDGNDQLYGYAGNDTLDGGAGSDTLIGGAGDDTLYGGEGNDTFVYANGGGNDTIKDYTEGEDTIEITDGSISSVMVSAEDVIFMVGSGSLTVENGAGTAISLKDGRGSYTASDTAIKLDSGFTGTMNANAYLSTVTSIDGSDAEGAVNITGNARNNTIRGGKSGGILSGGAGKDTLIGGAGNDTLNGGAGNDTFVYANGGGTDTIKDYTAGEDTIEITGGSVSSTMVSDEDVVFTVGEGSVTVEGASGKTISLKDGRGSYTASGTEIKLGSNFIGDMDANAYLSTVTSIDGSNVEDTVNITGNAQDNNIYAGKSGGTIDGGAGSDRLIGGADTDILKGGAGNDTFVYANGGGTDIILDYAEGEDTIEITGSSVSSTMAFGEDVVFTVGEGSVTVEGASGKTISLKDWRGSYTASGTEIKLGSNFTGDMDANAYLYLGAVMTIDGRNAEGVLNITGNQAGDNIIYAGKSGGMIGGGAGTDTLYGGEGDDTFVYESGNDTIYNYGNGTDIIKFNNNVTLQTSEVSNNDVLLQLSNGYTITVKNATDKDIAYLAFNEEEPTIIVPHSDIEDNAIQGTDDNDNIYGTENDDIIYGKAGNDYIEGYAGDDILYGGADEDDLYGGRGNDKLYGGTGDDQLHPEYGGTKEVYGEDGADRLYGGGDDLNDVIHLYGGTGNDTFVLYRGGAGSHIIYDYDSKNEIIELEGVTMTSNEAFENGTMLTLSNGGTVYVKDTNFEDISFKVTAIYGTDDDDELYGVDSGIYIEGYRGNDIIHGGAGDDSLYGGDGNDTIYGNGGSDQIYSESGSDTIYGGDGDDTIYAGSDDLTETNHLYGGLGDDTFTFYYGSLGKSIIYDYEIGHDIIRFEDAINFESSSVSGDNVTLNLSTGGKVDILGVVGQNITFDFGDGNLVNQTFPKA